MYATDMHKYKDVNIFVWICVCQTIKKSITKKQATLEEKAARSAAGLSLYHFIQKLN
jgi:hypothetical protein